VRWLGFDPSITAFGWALFEDRRLLECGTWKTKIDQDAGKLADRARRILELGRQIDRMLTEHVLAGVVIEGLVLGIKTGRPAVMTLGRVRGLVEGLCIARGLKLLEVRADQVKKAWTGRRDATKEEVALAVRRFFPMVAGASLDTTDAVSVGWAGRDHLKIGLVLTNAYTPPPVELPGGDDLDF
jgi:Holliday junction resolvasome RuvABC endonuclease subunit